MRWPTPQDFNESIQNPSFCFDDVQLKNGSVQLNELGLPRCLTGAFASVYRLRSQEKDWAVRCLLHDISDQQERYGALSRFIVADDLDFTVPFHYLRQGIRVGDKWFPVVSMEWVEGETLDRYVARCLSTPARLELLIKDFFRVVQEMRSVGIAHGDLQHGNIIVTAEGLRLVDYDGMYVPELSGLRSHEVGHRNYQHPQRSNEHFGPTLDNFSAWVIFVSLRILALDPLAMGRILEEHEGLLFTREDFLRPQQSMRFRYFEQHDLEEIRRLTRKLRAMLSCDCLSVPPLTDESLQPNPQDAEMVMLPVLTEDEAAALRSALLVKAMPVELVTDEETLPTIVVDSEADVTPVVASAPTPAIIHLQPELWSLSQVETDWPLTANYDLYKTGFEYLDGWKSHFTNELTSVNESRAKRWRAGLKGVKISSFLFAPFLLLLASGGWFGPLFFGVVGIYVFFVLSSFSSYFLYAYELSSQPVDNRIERVQKSIAEGTAIVVQYYLLGNQSDASLYLLPQRLPPDLINLPPLNVKNWGRLSDSERASLPLGADSSSEGYLVCDGKSSEPYVLVTSNNIALWLLADPPTGDQDYTRPHKQVG